MVREACPANIAPTTSTILMMALGDALAIAVMRTRGYTSAALHTLHPGGQIGLRLKTISSLMHGKANLPLVSPEDRMHDVILTMTSRSFGVAGVVDDTGCLIGVITDGDLRRHADHLMDSVAGDVMTKGPVMISVAATAEEAVQLMNDHRITTLFVMSPELDGKPIGIVHVHDLMRLGLI
jgi:arabinose-5-phosphate isomerase